jgi:hypothetical protein
VKVTLLYPSKVTDPTLSVVAVKVTVELRMRPVRVAE